MNTNNQLNSSMPHNIMLEQRSRLNMSGVLRVESFEEDNVELKTTKGRLTLRGDSMHMESYRSEVGDLLLEGNIYAIVYTDDKTSKEGFLSRIFK